MNKSSKRVTRIELATTAWKAVVLPLNYTRLLLKEMARDGIEPPTHGASIHCSTNWATEPNCGSRIWTYDLRVMSPTSYRAAPSRVNIKEDVGFEPTHAFTRLTVFKTVPFSRTWVILHHSNGPCRTWTYDHSVMSRELWPTELKVLLLEERFTSL